MYKFKKDLDKSSILIIFELNFDKIYKYLDGPTESEILSIESEIFKEIYSEAAKWGIFHILKHDILISGTKDYTPIFKFICLGLSESWSKFFIKQIHCFKVDPNTNAVNLLDLNKEINIEEAPLWFKKGFLTKEKSI
jgi:hypothetical protein